MSKKALLQNDPGGVSWLFSCPPSINCSNFTRPWACQQVSPPFKLQTPPCPCPCTFPPPLFLSLFTIALPRITFAHGTSPFTQEQFKAGRAGEDKGWNGHGLKVELSMNFSSLDICPGNSHSYQLQKSRFLSESLFIILGHSLILILFSSRSSSCIAGGLVSLSKEPLVFFWIR